MAWHRVAAKGDVKEDAALGVEANGCPLALFRIGDRCYATSNICTHEFAFLSDGYVEGEYVECPLHQGRFHIPTGKAQGVPVEDDVKTYAVKIEGDDVLVDVPEK
ncbi:MAG: non-heme iron oxygenase ferredoxin subunit [Alphaproteobacteria bacterium]